MQLNLHDGLLRRPTGEEGERHAASENTRETA